jgi:hypothetical protein
MEEIPRRGVAIWEAAGLAEDGFMARRIVPRGK